MDYWKDVWERKGETNTEDVNWLDGWAKDVPIDVEYVSKQIIKSLDIQPNDKILEIGCGGGALAHYIAPLCNYVGIDYTPSMVEKHIKILGNPVLLAEADNIPFKYKYFDKSFAYSVFHYFPDINYFKRTFREIQRVTKGSIFIGDLPVKSKRPEHLLYDKKDFPKNSIFSKGYWNPDRFNVLIK